MALSFGGSEWELGSLVSQRLPRVPLKVSVRAPLRVPLKGSLGFRV